MSITETIFSTVTKPATALAALGLFLAPALAQAQGGSATAGSAGRQAAASRACAA